MEQVTQRQRIPWVFQIPDLETLFLPFLFPAFVFCALLEFTFVNYMWRKLQPDVLRKVISVPDSASSGEGDYQTDHNGKDRGNPGPQTNSTPVAVTVVSCAQWGGGLTD